MRFLKSYVSHVTLTEEEEGLATSSPRVLPFFVANSPRIALRFRKPRLYSVGGVGRIGGVRSRDRGR